MSVEMEDVTSRVQKNLMDIYRALGTIVAEIDRADENGLSFDDIIPVVSGSFKDIQEAFKNVKQVAEGTQGDMLKSFVLTNGVGGGHLGEKLVDLIEDYLKKKEPVPGESQ